MYGIILTGVRHNVKAEFQVLFHSVLLSSSDSKDDFLKGENGRFYFIRL